MGVVGVCESLHPRVNLDALPDPVCEYCGETIEERDQPCVALDEGRCAP